MKTLNLKATAVLLALALPLLVVTVALADGGYGNKHNKPQKPAEKLCVGPPRDNLTISNIFVGEFENGATKLTIVSPHFNNDSKKYTVHLITYDGTATTVHTAENIMPMNEALMPIFPDDPILVLEPGNYRVAVTTELGRWHKPKEGCFDFTVTGEVATEIACPCFTADNLSQATADFLLSHPVDEFDHEHRCLLLDSSGAAPDGSDPENDFYLLAATGDGGADAVQFTVSFFNNELVCNLVINKDINPNWTNLTTVPLTQLTQEQANICYDLIINEGTKLCPYE